MKKVKTNMVGEKLILFKSNYKINPKYAKCTYFALFGILFLFLTVMIIIMSVEKDVSAGVFLILIVGLVVLIGSFYISKFYIFNNKEIDAKLFVKRQDITLNLNISEDRVIEITAPVQYISQITVNRVNKTACIYGNLTKNIQDKNGNIIKTKPNINKIEFAVLDFEIIDFFNSIQNNANIPICFKEGVI